MEKIPRRINRWLPLLCLLFVVLLFAYVWHLRRQLHSAIEKTAIQEARWKTYLEGIDLGKETAKFQREIVQTTQKYERLLLQAKLEGRLTKVTGTTADGKEFDWAQYHGKPVLLHSWAAACMVCQDDFQFIQDLQQECRAIDLQIVGLCQDSSRNLDLARQKLIEHEVSWTNLMPSGQTRPLINGLFVEWPATFILVDSNGTVRSVISPSLSETKEVNRPERLVPKAQMLLELLSK